jgi:hypothetical protein
MKTTYKNHPVFKEIKISNCGTKVKQHNIPLEVKEVFPKPNNPLMVVYMQETYFSLQKLVLETYKGYPKEKGRHYACPIDKNHKNTNPENLKWVKSLQSQYSPDEKLKKSIINSKINEKESYRCHRLFKQKKASLSQLAKEYNVSDMTIHRAVKRIEKYLTQKASATLVS